MGAVDERYQHKTTYISSLKIALTTYITETTKFIYLLFDIIIIINIIIIIITIIFIFIIIIIIFFFLGGGGVFRG